ncbi:FAD-dependent pyridine nucleotide-disulfideoxidoreductase [Natrarchaeobaculum sulfurireducens]|uniref:FAD-dependent pyridine nucleotide-disulfideoxidoreductase n=1 Tax=Natrarchaeobaculum sulfurireducens TaxID=2044521 RepID=A0A346PT61_9EURY|nr:FAD/NAD(P)-binding oxidoreductase [Natrarchaeobaculum sulfurireducens]AXR82706.1 FAD-dependent pyridine nucleotide-disulfideoxidoreductase [Natrarchaeobaculum sulfurireducens]
MDHIVVVGSGSGGTMAANILRRKLDSKAVEVTVIDKRTEHYYQPSFYLIPFGYLEPEQSRHIDELLKSGVEFVNDAVTEIDPDERTVTLAEGDDLEYDYLVVATGHRLDPSATPGLVEAWQEGDDVYPFYHYEAALELREALENFDGGTFLVTQPDTPIKCPGAPLKLTMLAEDYFRRRGIRDDVEVIMTRNAEHHFGVQPYRDALYEIWDDRDIEFKSNVSVDRIDPDAGVVHSADGEQIEYDLYAPVTPQFGQEAITDGSPLADGSEDGEYVTIDQHTCQHDEYDEIFALGDCENAPHSKTAAAARKQAHVVADNLEALVEDKPLRANYDGYAACPLLTEKGKAMIAEFDYEDSISAPVESKLNWIMDVNVLPTVYWDAWMKGYDPLP